jgi:sporulation protein YlmC with PRC-barrel domain
VWRTRKNGAFCNERKGGKLRMKKYLFITFISMAMLFAGGPAFAREKESSPGKSTGAENTDNAHINAFRVENIIRSRVMDLEGESIGSIDSLVIDIDTGGVLYAVLEFGGFLGIGDKLFAVPWQSLAALPVEGTFILDQPRAKLEKAPGFNKNNWPDIGDRRWGAGIFAFYNRRPPYRQQPTAPGKHPGPQAYPAYGYPMIPQVGYVGFAEPRPYLQMFNPKTVETVSGEIVKVEYLVPEPEFEQGTRLIIRSGAKKFLLVHLGPPWYIKGERNRLKPGTKVTATGSMVTVDDTPLMIATMLEVGNEKLKLRDEEGNPIWVGWRKVK